MKEETNNPIQTVQKDGENNEDDEYVQVKSEDLRSILDRVDKLEDSVQSLTETQAELSHAISKNSENLKEVTEEVDEFKQEVDELSKEQNIKESQINGITKNIERIESSISEAKGSMDTLESRLTKRINMVEESVGISDEEIVSATPDNASRMDKLATLPEESRKEQFTVRVQRAIALYENYHDLSTPVAGGGERLLSKDIKTFLNGYANTQIRYSQVQRVIDSFDEKTGEDYTVKQTEDGRGIFWEGNG